MLGFVSHNPADGLYLTASFLLIMLENFLSLTNNSVSSTIFIRVFGLKPIGLSGRNTSPSKFASIALIIVYLFG